MPLPFWNPGAADALEPGPWDALRIGDTEMPGLATVKPKRVARIDSQESPGVDGASQVTLGRKPSEVDVTVRIWTADHLDRLETLMRKILTPASKAPQRPVKLDHPALRLHGITSMFVAEVAGPEPSHTADIFELKLKFVEFLPGKHVGVMKAKGDTSIVNADKDMRKSQQPTGSATSNAGGAAASPPSATESKP
jgi:hypothetical protein